jgi:MFS superfamily sulfate permease-like transporter
MLFRDFSWWLMEVFESENSSIGSTIPAAIILTVIYGVILTICIIGFINYEDFVVRIPVCVIGGIMVFLLIRTYYKLIRWCIKSKNMNNGIIYYINKHNI